MSWKVTLPCTKAEAEALTGDIAPLALLDAPPVLMTSEPDPARPAEWRMDAYFEAEPGPDDLALLLSLAPSAGGAAPLVEALDEQDWVTLSQAGLEPIQAGRFFVHTPAHRDDIPAAPSLSRSTQAAPSAPASTKPRPAACSRSTG
jgi:ribosomal protein L11 methyltransferase